MILGKYSNRATLNRALLAGLGGIAISGAASAQQSTDVSLIGTKDWGSGSNPGFIMTFDSDSTWKINSNGASGTRIDTSWNGYSQDVWILAIGTWDRDGNISSYQDGVFIDSDPAHTGNIDTFGSGLDLNIGQDGTGNYAGGQGFQGYVDEVAVWRRALDASEITYIYDQAINSSNNLAAITGNNGGGAGLIGDDLVGYYGFEGNANDTSGSTNVNNGFWSGTEQYVTDQFGGQAALLDGSSYITIGDDAAFPSDYTFGDETTGTDFTFMAWVLEEAPPQTNFIGGSGDNFATSANWGTPLGGWDDETIAILGNNPSNNPVVIDNTLGTQMLGTLVMGEDGETLTVNMSGGELVAEGSTNSAIGAANGVLNLNMTGGTINHTGGAEEGSQLDIAQAGSTVNLVMSNDAVIASGNYEQDASYAIGYRRPLTSDSPAQDRHGDDIDLGNGGDLNLTMNNNALIYTPDVFYPHDSGTEADVTVVQNDNSVVAVGWDTRFFDTGGPDEDTGNRSITWTMNDNSQFLVARDHGLGEAGIIGDITININDNALFYAGGRIAAGAGFEGNVEINQTGGRLQAGSAIGNPGGGGDLTVDGTGVDATGTVRDGVLWMGEGANSVIYNLSGGNADITRTAFVGADGAATINQSGGTFKIWGTGSVGSVDGNDTVGIPITEWTDGGGDLFLGRIEGDAGTYNLSGGTLDVARNIFLGFDSSDGTVVGGTGNLIVEGTGDLDVAGGVAVGGDGNGTLTVRGGSATIDVGVLAVGGIAGTESGSGTLDTRITGATHTAINVAGSTLLQNNAGLTVELDVETATYRPGIGDSFVLINHASIGGDAGTFSSVTDTTVDGIVWDVSYSNSDVVLTAVDVFISGDANGDGLVDGLDVDALAQGFGLDGNWSAGDFTNDGIINGLDVDVLAQSFGAGQDAAIQALSTAGITAVPEPTSAILLGLGGLITIRRRRSA